MVASSTMRWVSFVVLAASVGCGATRRAAVNPAPAPSVSSRAASAASAAPPSPAPPRPAPTCPAPVLSQVAPSGNDLDTKTYDALVEEHALSGFARSIALRDWLGEVSPSFDLAAARAEARGRGSFGMQILGTYASASKTYLWSWANPSIVPCAPKERANAIHDKAAKDGGPSPFLQRKIAEEWVPHRELVAVVADLEEKPWLAVPYGNDGGVALVLASAPIPAFAVDAGLAKRAIDEGLRTVVSRAPAEMVARFLKKSGFDVVRTGPLRLDARRGSESLAVVWTGSTQQFPRVDVPGR